MPQLSVDRNLPQAITNIRLGSALQNCGAISVANAFDKSNAPCLYVYDDQHLGHTDWTDQEPEFASKCFRADNPNGVLLILLPLDGCIITGANVVKDGVCDCMLLTEQEMSMVEFKTNVSSSNNLTIIQRANEAIQQLWHTYNEIVRPRCITKSRIPEKLLAVDFHIAFDELLNVTGAQSSLMDMQDDFLEDKKYPLYFNNKKTFF